MLHANSCIQQAIFLHKLYINIHPTYIYKHAGTTLPGEPCTTISVGFRSPNYQYLVTAFWDYVTRSSLNSDNSYYTDGDLKLGTSPGRIDGAASAHIVEDIRQKVRL